MTRFKKNPIPRHEALAPFSRDHYAGLVQSQRLQKAVEKNAVERRKVVAEFLDAWDSEIKQHFEDEERVLADYLSKEQFDQLIQEHRQLEDDAKALRALRKQVDPDAKQLEAIGTRLEQHIRWEERTLFNEIQASLNEQQLAHVQQITQDIEAKRPRSACRPETSE